MNAGKLAAPTLLMAMFMTSLMAIAIRNLVDEGLSVFDATFLRLSIAAAVIVLAVIATRSWHVFKIKPRDLVFFILFAVFKFLSDYTLFHSLDTISVGLAALLQNIAPYFVMVMAFFLFREKVGGVTLFAVMMGSFGCILMSGKALMSQSIDVSGIVSALLSAFFLGTFFVGSRINNDRGYSTATYLAFVFIGAALAALPFSNIGDIATGMTKPSVLFNALSLGIVMTMIPYYIIGWSTRYLSPVTVAVICVSEVIFAVIIGTLYYGEPLDIQDILGVLLLVGSIVMISLADAKKRKGKDAASPESSDPVDGEISG